VTVGEKYTATIEISPSVTPRAKATLQIAVGEPKL
jgi:hypothetical protein